MIEFLLGIMFYIWAIIMAFLFYKVEENSTLAIFFGILFFLGTFLSIKGLRKIIINLNTNIKGEECYGKICNIYGSGIIVNGKPELKADFLVYINSIHNTKLVSEVIGFDKNKYPIDSYVKLKYCNNDVNIINIIEVDELPLADKYQLDKAQEANFNKKDTIIVDGVKYVKKDNTEIEYIRKDN